MAWAWTYLPNGPEIEAHSCCTDTCNAHASCTLYWGTRCDRSFLSCVFLTIVAAQIIINHNC